LKDAQALKDAKDKKALEAAQAQASQHQQALEAAQAQALLDAQALEDARRHRHCRRVGHEMVCDPPRQDDEVKETAGGDAKTEGSGVTVIVKVDTAEKEAKHKEEETSDKGGALHSQLFSIGGMEVATVLKSPMAVSSAAVATFFGLAAIALVASRRSASERNVEIPLLHNSDGEGAALDQGVE